MTDLSSDDQAYTRVEKAIRWLSDNYQEQPRLADVASQIGLSEHHFQRLFTRWAGVSPKKFVEYLTLSHAKARLDAADSVLDAAYDAGLSGPGRLHDLFVTHEAVTPGEWKSMGQGLVLRYGWHPSPFGDCLLVTSDRGLCGLGFELEAGRDATEEDLLSRWGAARLVEDPDAGREAAGRAFGALDGPLHLVLRGTPFQIKVWEGLMQIPSGVVTSYERLAASLEHPKAARAVAGAVARNPISWIVPCHRVIRSTGAVTGYRWGPIRKRAMLGWEAAQSELQDAVA